MTFNEFVSKLRRLNGRIRAFRGKGHIAGLYLYMPKHPMSNPETGLKHLGGMPSSFFCSLPKFSFWDDRLGGFNKGYHGVLRDLTEMRFAGRPVIYRKEAVRTFGYFPPTAKLPARETPVWWGKKRLREKYQLEPLRAA